MSFEVIASLSSVVGLVVSLLSLLISLCVLFGVRNIQGKLAFRLRLPDLTRDLQADLAEYRRIRRGDANFTARTACLTRVIARIQSHARFVPADALKKAKEVEKRLIEARTNRTEELLNELHTDLDAAVTYIYEQNEMALTKRDAADGAA